MVQRAPPQPGQRGNDGGQGQGQNQGSQVWQNPQRTHYRLTRAQMHGNAMYLGAMSVPAEIVEGHGTISNIYTYIYIYKIQKIYICICIYVHVKNLFRCLIEVFVDKVAHIIR